MDFEGSAELVRHAEAMAPRLRALKHQARAAGLPTIYVNDNFGKWRSDFRALVDHCLNDGVPGQNVARMLRPDHDDYFVLKPMQSAFYGTTLEILLRRLAIRGVILTGIAGNNCILFSAHDAYMRDLRLWVPADCVVSNTTAENDYALEQMAKVTKADVRPSTEIDLNALVTFHASHPTPLTDTPSRRQ